MNGTPSHNTFDGASPELALDPSQPLGASWRSSRAGWWAVFTTRAIALGLLVSLLVHLTLGGVLYGIWIRGGGDGSSDSGGPGGGGVQSAIMSEGELNQLMGGAVDDSAPALAGGMTAEVAPSDDRLSGPPGDQLAGGEALSTITGGPSGGGDVAGDGGIGAGPGGAGGGGGGTSFFGVEARGDRFAFIIDISGSMLGDRIAELKSQLKGTILELSETSTFIVITFSTQSNVLGEKVEWTEATQRKKGWALEMISGLNADGNTIPLDAFKLLQGLRPKPDAIFFMTDGGFDPGLIAWLEKNNVGPRVKIHCICFEDNQGETVMKEIAQRSHGTYKFVPRRTR